MISQTYNESVCSIISCSLGEQLLTLPIGNVNICLALVGAPSIRGNAQHTCGFSTLLYCTPKVLSFSHYCLSDALPRSSIIKSQRTSHLTGGFYFLEPIMVVAWVAGFPGLESYGAHHPPEDQATHLLSSLSVLRTPLLSCLCLETQASI